MSKKEKVAWIVIAFALLGAELYAMQSKDSEDAAQAIKAHKDEDNLFAAILKKNQEQFDATMVRSNKILSAQQESLNTFTGGNSFCYISPAGNIGLDVFTVTQSGAYPLYGVQARVVNLGSARKLTPLEELQTALSGAENLTIGDLGRHMTGVIKFPVPLNDKADYNIFFTATRNGFWTEQLRIRKVKNSWSSALRVTKLESNKQVELMKPRISKDFPERVDWTK